MKYPCPTTALARRAGREIVLTAEVYSMACHARDAGALVFGLSDKPVEASIPQQSTTPGAYSAAPQPVKILGRRWTSPSPRPAKGSRRGLCLWAAFCWRKHAGHLRALPLVAPFPLHFYGCIMMRTDTCAVERL
jgi:hypothetical protein